MVGERFTIFTFLKYAFIAIFALLIIYPMLNILATSMSGNEAILTGRVTFYPIGFNFAGYKMIIEKTNLVPAYINTLKYVILHTIVALAITTCGAYALSKGNRLWGYNIFMPMILFTMFFGGGMIPTYLTMKSYNLLNTTAVIVLMGAVSSYNRHSNYGYALCE